MGTAAAQTASTDNAKPAANAWMLTPTPYGEWNNDISPSLRKARDLVWDESAMSPVPLTKLGHGSMSTAEHFDLTADPNDIRRAVNRAILTGTFTAHRSVLSVSELSLYTEATFRVDQVFNDQTGSGHPFTNGEITVTFYGGTVSLPSGKLLSVSTQPLELFLQPEHKYLLVLSYKSKGDFYEYLDSWDISDGVVRANTRRTQYLAKSGRSELDGIAVQQIGPVLDREIHDVK